MAEGEPSLVEAAESLPALPLDGHWMRVDWQPLAVPELASELVAAHRSSDQFDLIARAASARSLVIRTGFVPSCAWHFVVKRNGRWFVWEDMDGLVDAGGIDPPVDVRILSGDPPAFRDFPADLREALDGDTGPIAWALQVLREEAEASRTAVLIENELTGFGHTARHLDQGDSAAAVEHLSALFRQHRSSGFEVGLAMGRAEERAKNAVEAQLRARQQNAKRSAPKLKRIEVLVLFLDRQPETTSNLEIARCALAAKQAGDPLFADVWLTDQHQPDQPTELAKDVAAAALLRKRRRNHARFGAVFQQTSDWLRGDMKGPAPTGDPRSDDDT